MSRLLNKKEEVIELKLTSHGKYLLGAGKFKPVYYGFLDDNIVYDAAYAGIDETQSAAQKRIKEDTQYLESLILFQDLEDYDLNDEIDEMEFMPGDVKPRDEIQTSEFYRFDQLLGDAFLLGESRVAPSWKVVALKGQISSSHFMDTENKTRIPQINLSSSYFLRTMDAEDYADKSFNSSDPLDHMLSTQAFTDNKVIYLDRGDPVLYIDEVNTQLLTENFDVEIFEFAEHESKENKKVVFSYLKRKYFTKKQPQIVDGLMVSSKKQEAATDLSDLSTQSVDYYFDILMDKQIDKETACRGATYFNKESYYIDLDHDCGHMEDDDINYDIYGDGSREITATPDIYGPDAQEPEICQD
jgi:hypothetical protein